MNAWHAHCERLWSEARAFTLFDRRIAPPRADRVVLPENEPLVPAQVRGLASLFNIESLVAEELRAQAYRFRIRTKRGAR